MIIATLITMTLEEVKAFSAKTWGGDTTRKLTQADIEGFRAILESEHRLHTQESRLNVLQWVRISPKAWVTFYAFREPGIETQDRFPSQLISPWKLVTTFFNETEVIIEKIHKHTNWKFYFYVTDGKQSGWIRLQNDDGTPRFVIKWEGGLPPEALKEKIPRDLTYLMEKILPKKIDRFWFDNTFMFDSELQRYIPGSTYYKNKSDDISYQNMYLDSYTVEDAVVWYIILHTFWKYTTSIPEWFSTLSESSKRKVAETFEKTWFTYERSTQSKRSEYPQTCKNRRTF